MHTEVPGDADNGDCGDGSGHYGDRKSQPQQKNHTNSIFIALSHAWAFCGFTVGCMDAIVEMIIIIILQW